MPIHPAAQVDPGARAPIGLEPPHDAVVAVRDAIHECWRRTRDSAFDPAAPVVRLHEPTFGADEIVAAVECMLSTKVTMGEHVVGFERRFARHTGAAHGVMCNSGSSANLLAVAALADPAAPGGLRPGDEVIVPALSWSTTVWPLLQHGLVPVIVDIDPDTWNLDPDRIAEAVGPRTRAVMVVHVYGNPCDMEAIGRACDDHDLLLIEDCCEALGASWDGRPVGRFGAVGTFSFYYSHHITTLEGGICVTDDARLGDRLRILRAHGWIRDVEDPAPWRDAHPGIDERFLFVDVGYNLRPTELAGTLGIQQLPRLEAFVAARRRNAAWFAERLAPFEGLLSWQHERRQARSSWFGFGVRVADDAPFVADDLRRHLVERGIETRPIICGNIARQPALRGRPHRVPSPLPNADAIMDRALSFGVHQGLDVAARSHVVAAISEFVASRT